MAPLPVGKFLIRNSLSLGRKPCHQLRAFAATPGNEDPKPLTTTNLAALKRGKGGRSSFNGVVATVFGASGFLGRYVVNRLGKMGTQVIIPYRGDHSDVIRMKLCGDLGQILYAPFYLRDEESLSKAMKYSNVVINLIGRDFETKNFKYNDVHVDAARTIARLARENGVEKLIHISSLNIAPKFDGVIRSGGSRFLKSKWHGEHAVREEFPDAIIIRPAEMYGSEDRYMSYYAHPVRQEMRYMPLWNKGKGIIKQPISVTDVSRGIVNAISDKAAAGKTYQAIGPRRYELGELIDWFFKVMRKDKAWGYRRINMKYTPSFRIRATLSEKLMPAWPILVWDKIEREHTTDVVTKGMPTLEDLGVQLTNIEDYGPWVLRPYRAHAYYNDELDEFPDPPPPKFVTN